MHLNIKEEFQSITDGTSEEILIISPFIGYQTAKYISTIASSGVKVVLITRFSRQDFYSGVSSIQGLKLISDSGGELLAVKKLHTKLYIFDKKTAILGSSNFTEGGLSSNIELNILVKNEPELLPSVIDYFNECYISIQKKNYITTEIIANEIKIIESFRSNKTDRKFLENTIFGEDLKTKKIFDDIESSFNKIESTDKATAWLKYEGFSDSNRDNPDNEIKPLLVDGMYKTYFSRKPTGFKTGDVVFIARHTTDRSGHNTPMIYGYGFVREFEERNVRTIEEQEADEKKKRWPYFVYVEKFIYSNNKIGDCLSLKSIYEQIGGSLFPSTESDIDYSEFKRKYSQRSHMHISESSKSYLLNEIKKII